MGKLKEIANTFKGIFLNTDNVTSTGIPTEEQINEIKNSDSSEDIKKELAESLTKIDTKINRDYILKTSELKVKKSINNEKIKATELNSIKNIAEVKEKIDNIDIDEIDR